MKANQFSKIKKHLTKRCFVKIKGERGILEATLQIAQADYIGLRLIKGDFKGYEPNAEFRVGINEIEELHIVPSWFKEGVEVVSTHKYSNKGVVGKIRTEEILAGGGYIAAWVENISGALELAYLKPTDESLIEELFFYSRNEFITNY